MCGEAQRFRRAGLEPRDPAREPFGLDEQPRALDAARELAHRVGRVQRREARERFFESKVRDAAILAASRRSARAIVAPGERLYATRMKYRELGRTGFRVSTVSFGCWAIGGTWGDVDDTESMAALHRALELGVNFFDTADVYGDGHSERLLRRLRKERVEPFFVATKAGRRASPHVAAAYNRENLTQWVERSLENLGVEALDLLQLHCPPTEVYYQPEVFGVLDDLVRAGKLKHYGVSVERVEEALKAVEFPGVQSVQIIFNVFRQRPAELFFEQARRKQVGILARLPLSSGLFGGKLKRDTVFGQDDHRRFNRKGEAFDRGETFSGIDYEHALSVIEQIKPLVPAGSTLPELALRWILGFDAVTCAIPGAKRPVQVAENVTASDLPPLEPKLLAELRAIYEQHIKQHVHHYW
jgi:aryl-alcohol dehydrogenase-like predicted oxidoreductase